MRTRKRKDCPVCKKSFETGIRWPLRHHVYLFDDGLANKQKYHKWIIPICQSCNIRICQINRLIKKDLLKTVVSILFFCEVPKEMIFYKTKFPVELFDLYLSTIDPVVAIPSIVSIFLFIILFWRERKRKGVF